MSKIQDTAAAFFILCVAILTAISVLGVWDIFGADVIWKSFQTLGLLAVVSIVVIIAGRFVGTPVPTVVSAGMPPVLQPPVYVPRPGFRAMRNATLGILIVSAALLAFLGVLAIWEVISEKETVYKALSSLGIIAFGAIIIVMTCLEREGTELWKRHGHQLSGGAVLLLILVSWLLASTLF